MESTGPGVRVHPVEVLVGLDAVPRGRLVVKDGEQAGPPKALPEEVVFGPLSEADAVAADLLLALRPEEVPVRDSAVLVGGRVLGRPRAVRRRAGDIV